jgi:hypothetical protein
MPSSSSRVLLHSPIGVLMKIGCSLMNSMPVVKAERNMIRSLLSLFFESLRTLNSVTFIHTTVWPKPVNT